VTCGNTQLLTQTLVESFNALADEVQNLSDRQTILEHKLRYAHEQVCPDSRDAFKVISTFISTYNSFTPFAAFL
jgi:lysyl-tRNA synthetase class II